jgi:hypothetical protein
VSTIDSLLAIFTINKLRDLKKHCRDSTVCKRDLADFIMWCRSSAEAPFLHSSHHRQFVPEHLTLSDSGLAALAANGVGRFTLAAQKNSQQSLRHVRRTADAFRAFVLERTSMAFFLF